MTPPQVRILHETNPQKYFPALYELSNQGSVTLTGSHRYSVIKEWLRSGLKDRTPLRIRSQNAWNDLCFRLTQGSVKDETIVMGFAPWDWRILIYRGLARRNRIIYHTSWHDWRIDQTPRQPISVPLKHWLRDIWFDFLSHPNVQIVAVTPVVAGAVKIESGQAAVTIPHAVPKVFYEQGRKRERQFSDSLRLLFVGEVSTKKGIGVLREVMDDLATRKVELTIIGTGPLAADLQRNSPAGTRYLGPIHDRAALARQMSEHDVLVLPSQRTEGWEELFGIVIVEAIAAGLAVLASDHVGPRGILGSLEGQGLFREDDHTGLRAKILALAQDRTRLDGLRRAQAPLAEAFEVASVSRAWLEIIET